MSWQKKWTKEDELKILAMANNYTKAEIAKEMGISRNSVIGKLHRLKGSPRPIKKPLKHRVTAVRNKNNKLFCIQKTLDIKPLMDLRASDCRYPINDRYCSANIVAKGQSYCEEHYNICHRTNWKGINK